MTTKIRLQAGKVAYTETEAARALGVSLDQFRSLLLHHLVNQPVLGALQLTRFHPCDLQLLGFAAQRATVSLTSTLVS